MRAQVTVHDTLTDYLTTAIVDVDDDEPAGALVPGLAALAAADLSGADRGLGVDGVPVAPDTPVAAAGIRDGSWLSLLPEGGRPRPRVTAVRTGQTLRVVSGRGAGTTYHFEHGAVSIGTDASAQVRLPSGAEAVRVLLHADGAGHAVVDVVEGGGVTVDGEPLEAGRRLEIGDQLAFEQLIIEFSGPGMPDAAVQPDPATGRLRFNRPPRVLPAESDPRFRLPSEPTAPERAPLPWLVSLAPLLLAGAMVLIYRNPAMLIFGLMSPVMLLGGWMTNRSTGRKRYLEQLAEYAQLTQRIEHDAAEALAAERVQRLNDYPDATRVAEIAVTPAPRLWERRPGDPAWLGLRIGTASQDSRVSLEDPAQLEHRRTVVWSIRHAPAVVSLADAGVIGLAGADDSARSAARWLTAQLAVLHSPKDLRIVVLDGVGEDDEFGRAWWDFASWLPHATPSMSQDCVRTVAATADAVAARLRELSELIRLRTERKRQDGTASADAPAVAVVIDGAHRLRALPGLVGILRDGPAVGVYAICVERDERMLPEECDTIAVYHGSHATIRRQKSTENTQILVDEVDADWLDWVARALAPLEDASPSQSDASLPESSRLLEVLRLETPSAEDIHARWLLNPRSTRAVLGEGLDGAFAVDLVTDGPHGLIAGTTGSGKSELLQTIVAALATANAPTEMNFVLVDYKGGAAFKDCVDLPHTVGMVTDLDAHLVGRALESLGAELRTRERMLAEVGAKDLGDYLELAARRGLPSVPRLLIVIDEFASLARELPDFVTGLVNIAQRGRSLGIHLLLATQRPSGVISPEIRANTNLKIALRVTDAAESADVIDASDAATISRSTPGRAYARLGAGTLLPFQTARVGGRAPIANGGARPAPLLRRLTFADLGVTPPRREENDAAAGDVELTDLRLLVDAIRAAAALAETPEQRRPWLPPLPASLDLGTLLRDGSAATDRVVIGREDRPALQQQRPAVFDLETTGHLYLVGAARSGKTTALRTLAVSAAITHSTADLHVYGLDCGNGGLLPLAGLPNTGEIVAARQREQAVRLIGKLRAEVRARQNTLAAAGVSSLVELRRLTAEAPAHVLVVIDSWDGFLAAFGDLDGGAMIDAVRGLMREGTAAGIHVVITGDRQLLTGPMSTLADRKLLLRLIDRGDYTFAGLKARDVPEQIVPGRAFEADSGVEVQLASIRPELAPHEQTAQLRQIAEELVMRDRDVPRAARPFRVREIPARITYREARAAAEGDGADDGTILIGIGGADAGPIGYDPSQSGSFVIAGTPRSGRSTALAAMALSALDHGYHLLSVTPRGGALRELDGLPGVIGSVHGTALAPEDLAIHLDDPAGKTIVAIDDAELLRDCAADARLREYLAHATQRGIGFLIAGDAAELGRGFSGWLVEARKPRRGLVLNPVDALQGDVVGVRLSRSDIQQERPVGRGWATDASGATVLVQVPEVHAPALLGAGS